MTASTPLSLAAEHLSMGAFDREFAVSAYDAQLAKESQACLELQRVYLMSQFARYQVHDAIQPLTAICNYSGGMLSRLSTTTPAKEQLSYVLSAINQSALRACEMVKQLGGYSYSNSDEVSLISVNDVIDDSLKRMDGFLRSQRIKVEMTLVDRLPDVRANSGELMQVILNLVKNAVDAMQSLPMDSRSIEILTSEAVGSIQIAIRDSGPTIPDDLLVQFTRPFFTTKSNCVGLGLWASRTIVRQFKGDLHFCQRSPQGLEAIVHLPIA